MWLNKNNYKEYLKGISVVEVSGESCANCLSLMPILDELIKNYKNVNLFHIEVNEENLDLVNEFNIFSVPTILVLYNLDIKASVRGFQPEEILELWLDAKIDDIKKEYKID